MTIKYISGCVAQLVAQLTLNQLVVGSSPTTPTIYKKDFFGGLFFVDMVRTRTHLKGSSANELRVFALLPIYIVVSYKTVA